MMALLLIRYIVQYQKILFVQVLVIGDCKKVVFWVLSLVSFPLIVWRHNRLTKIDKPTADRWVWYFPHSMQLNRQGTSSILPCGVWTRNHSGYGARVLATHKRSTCMLFNCYWINLDINCRGNAEFIALLSFDFLQIKIPHLHCARNNTDKYR